MKRAVPSSVLGFLTFAALAATVGCGGAAKSPLPSAAQAWPESELTLVWVGRGEASVFQAGAYQRSPKHDYDFMVVQRRYRDRWESVKEMHRRHPDYDGSAGPRDQSYYFRMGFAPRAGEAAEKVGVTVTSTWGPGAGVTDPEFRHAALSMRPDVSSFAPFDTLRLQQHYRYEEGSLEETVELVDHSGGKEVPYVRNEERATLYATRRFDAPPTRFAAP